MVATTSTIQVAENERRMRKNTLDKVKANHVCEALVSKFLCTNIFGYIAIETATDALAVCTSKG